MIKYIIYLLFIKYCKFYKFSNLKVIFRPYQVKFYITKPRSNILTLSSEACIFLLWTWWLKSRDVSRDFRDESRFGKRHCLRAFVSETSGVSVRELWRFRELLIVSTLPGPILKISREKPHESVRVHGKFSRLSGCFSPRVYDFI